MAYRDLMRVATVRSTAAVALALCSGLVLATLSACAAEPGPTPTTSKATDAPVFASDEEALAAAEKAYAAYLAVDDEVASRGGIDPTPYENVATGDALSEAIQSAKEMLAAHAHATGHSSFRVHKLQLASYSNPSQIRIDVYVCDDVSGTDLLDEAGKSLVLESRVEVIPFVVGVTGAAADGLLVASRELWGGENYCIEAS